MRIRVILEARGWDGRLHLIQELPGRYAVEKRDLNGAKLKPNAITGSFPSIDFIIENAEVIYLQLTAMIEANKASSLANTHNHEITTAHACQIH